MPVVKTKKEIQSIAKACKITDEIFLKITRNFVFKTERELALWIRREIKNRGLREAFPPIVTSGSRAGNSIHPTPTNEKMEGFVIIDFGVRVNGYCSDMTRTMYVGKPTKEERDLYKLVLKSKTQSEKFVSDGLSCARSDNVARKTLGEYKKYFIHTLGHGVGKRIHEAPKIYEKYTDVYLENMAVTIEPGIYIPNKLGIRIEDTLLVTKKKPLFLTKSPLELLIFRP